MKHHYVPASYLRAFVDPACPRGYEPFLWLVDLEQGTVRRRSPDNAATLTDYYAVSSEESRYDVETHLGEVESKAAPILASILDDRHTFEGDAKAVLSYFAALQIVRVPSFRERIEKYTVQVAQTLNSMILLNRDRFERSLRQAIPDRMFSASEVDALYAGARDTDNYTISANPEAALGHALKLAPKIAELLNRMSWAVMEPAGPGNYWSSDNPVFFINPSSGHPFIGHGLAATDIEVNFPIGPRRCLMMAWSEIEGARVPMTDIRCAQERGIISAKRYLFCSTEGDATEALKAHRRMFSSRTTPSNESS